ncbi:SGNH/GDSL hydrolase family protein [Pelomonas sp. SE-A7]|uniref:SGNH/GDSL hydrolase family protein n=1 Tax=Pelomonas sp. SE-A7 TaxID=3054953 RepID=UPI00259C8386|nr:SGNH/GDSL hydrolase family protein [Pelomonas sp. SE-A7]MDM4766722.1 SGNH/GDSL hydrolase family protein [Pelomonas sp. SE-A7]
MNRFKQSARQLGLALLAVSAAVLAGCGGGSEPIEKFAPKRIMAFGDESSTITSQGKKYTVNAVDTNGNLVCMANPIWVQTVAAGYGMVFPQCNPENIAAPQGQMYAKAGAKVADVAAQLDVFFSTGSFNAHDLVTMMAGANDILELYSQFPAVSRDSLINSARDIGKRWAAQVNRVADAGGRVVVTTLPDQGVTPYALKEKQTKQDTDRAKFLTELTTEFNTYFRLNIRNDGRAIGLVLADEMTQTASRYPAYASLINATDAMCLTTVTIADCTTKTILAESDPATWLWANDKLLSPAGHHMIGQSALSRAVNNPF